MAPTDHGSTASSAVRLPTFPSLRVLLVAACIVLCTATWPTPFSSADGGRPHEAAVAGRRLLATSAGEKEALLAMKAALYHIGGAFTLWTEAADPCTDSWPFVVCAGGGVTELSLTASQIVGTLSPAILNLVSLTKLNLGGSQISGYLPAQLHVLSSLQYISIMDTSVSGTLPPEFGSLTSLRELYLDDAMLFSGTLPPQYGSMTSLQVLTANYCPLSGTLPRELFGGASALREMQMIATTISGFIPPEVGLAPALEKLWVFSTRLSGTVPPAIANAPSLKRVDFSDTFLWGSIPPAIGLMPNLIGMDLSGNLGICGPSVTRVTSTATSVPRACPAYCMSCEEMSVVQDCLDTADLTGVDYGCSPMFPACVGGDIDFNNHDAIKWGDQCIYRDKIGLLQLKASLSDPNDTLATWTVDSDPCYDGWDYVQCDQNNAVTALHFDALPNLSGTIAPYAFAMLTSLTSLAFIDTSISGTIPPSLGDLDGLESLQMYWDTEGSFPLSGTIPRELFSLSALKTLRIGANLISGTIPDNIGSALSLETLMVSDTRLSGTVPASMGEISNLHDLQLDRNNLEGALPHGLAGRSGISINVSDNPRLCGVFSIPGDFFYNDTAIGQPCACNDTQGSDYIDRGCENIYDEVWGSYPAAICYTGEANNGTGLPGLSVHPQGSAFYFRDDVIGPCSVCLDDQNGTSRDLGCPAEAPFCVDVDVDFDASFRNDGNNGRGLVCAACIADLTGNSSGISETDTGCPPDKPFCYSYSKLMPALDSGSFGGPTASPPDNDPGICITCLDSEPDELGSAFDAGCSASQPFCVTTGLTINTNQIEFPVDLGTQCYVCKDTEPGTLVDLGCGEKRPVCRVDYSGGYGTACDTINPSCYFSSSNITPDDDAVCSTPYKLEALLSIKLLDCITVNVSLPDIVANLTQLITPAVPACALELTVIPREDMISQAGAGTDISASSSRKLLQGPVVDYELILALRVYVESVTQGSALKDLLNSLQFGAYLSDALAWIGSVPDIIMQVVFDYASASVQSDPHFTTAAGNKFDFPGAPGQTFCIVSDKQVQVNARFMGAVNAEGAVAAAGSPSQPDTRTWMDQIGFMYGKDRVLIDAKSGPGTPFSVSFGVVAANGEMLLGRRANKRLPSGMTVSRAKTRILVTMPEVMIAEVEVVRAAFWEPGAGPGANFLNLQVKQFNNSASVHGVLGQSYAKRPDQPLVEGDMGDYRTSGILATDCRFDQFGSSAV
eukprot:jgi/Mesvir1/3470/Mv11963-RA.1